MLRWLGLLLFVTLSANFTFAQATAPALAGVRDDRLLIAQGNGAQILQVDLKWRDGPLMAQPGGEGLLYVMRDEAEHLMYWDGLQHIELTTNFVADCSPTFTPDGQAVYYLQQDPIVGIIEATPSNREQHWVVRQPLQANAILEQVELVELNISGGGGDGPPYPMEDIFWSEQGGFGIPPVFEVTSYGVIYRASVGCFSGLRLTHDGVTTDLPGNKLAVSPDGTQAAIVDGRNDQFLIVDLQTMQQRTIAVNGDLSSPYFQVHWADAIYYTVIESTETDYGLSPGQREAFAELSYALLDLTHDSQVYRLDPQTGQQALIYSAPKTWAISRMQSTDQYLYFSQIPDAQPIVDAFLAGEIVAGDYGMLTALVTPAVYRMPLGGGPVELVQRDLEQFVPYAEG